VILSDVNRQGGNSHTVTARALGIQVFTQSASAGVKPKGIARITGS
jgi:hypothetical protein